MEHDFDAVYDTAPREPEPAPPSQRNEYGVPIRAAALLPDDATGVPGKLRRSYQLARLDREALLEGALSGPAAPLPYRAEMERAFGADFSSVHAHVGRVGELTTLGARAAARGESVAFASHRPDRQTVAHELAHVLQSRRGRGGAGESRRDDRAEREADRVAPLAAAGAHVRVSTRAAAQVHFMTEEALDKLIQQFAKGNGSAEKRLRSLVAQYLEEEKISLADWDSSDASTQFVIWSLQTVYQDNDKDKQKQEQQQVATEQPLSGTELPRLVQEMCGHDKELHAYALLNCKKRYKEQGWRPTRTDARAAILKLQSEFTRAAPPIDTRGTEGGQWRNLTLENAPSRLGTVVVGEDLYNLDAMGEPELVKLLERLDKEPAPATRHRAEIALARLSKKPKQTDKIDDQLASQYLDVLAKQRPERVNDGLRPKEANSNCALCSMAALLGWMTSDIVKAMGKDGTHQDDNAMLSGFHESLGSRSGELGADLEGQLNGIQRFVQETVSGQIAISRGGTVKNSTKRKKDDHYEIEGGVFSMPGVAEAVQQMKLCVPGTQFVCLCGAGTETHFVYAEIRGKDIVFQDYQPQLAPQFGFTKNAPNEAVGPTQRPTDVNRPTAVPQNPELQSEQRAFTRMVFLAFEPSPDLVKSVLQLGSADPHGHFASLHGKGK